MTALDHNAAFAPLTEGELEQDGAANKQGTGPPAEALPIPREELDAIPAHPRLGRPSVFWVYHDKIGQPIEVVCRYDPPGQKKEFRPLIWSQNVNGREGWAWTHPPGQRPLYRLDQLAARPADPVLVVEGEKTTEAAGQLLSDTS